MFCANCGTQNEIEARFCGECGALISTCGNNTATSEQPPTQEENAWRSQPLPYAIADGIEIAECRHEIARLQKSLLVCRIAGLICGMLFAAVTGPLSDPITNTASWTFPFLVGFFAPYGYAILRRRSGTRSYFIVFNWFFILIEIYIALFFVMIFAIAAVVLGPIYAIYAHAKIAIYKKRIG